MAGSLGRGLVAGLVGTGVMTLAQMIEMRIRHREPSTAAARAAEKAIGIEPRSEDAEQRLNQIMHFAYGSAWGLARGLLGSAGVGATAANSLHLLLVWGAALAMLPRLDLAPPVREWSKAEIAQDLGMHALYALATGATYEWLDRRR